MVQLNGTRTARADAGGDWHGVLTASDVHRAVLRMAHQIADRNRGTANLSVIGIINRGQHLASRLVSKLAEIEGNTPLLGEVSPLPFRDDMKHPAPTPEQLSRLAPLVKGRTVVLVDDVLNTGRTARAAIEALVASARPASIQLAAMVDRGHRELPIKPDYVGKNIPTATDQRVLVVLSETDGEDAVYLAAAAAGPQPTPAEQDARLA